MFPWTHLVYGRRLGSSLGVRDWGLFNLGSVIPDLRYANGASWEDTHPDMEVFWSQVHEQGLVDDFALGVLLHLGMDQWERWYLRVARAGYPLGGVFPRRVFKLLLEAAALQLYPLGHVPMTVAVPPAAALLHLSPETISWVRSFGDEVLAHPGIDEAVRFVQRTDLARVPGIRFLMWLALAVLKTPLGGLLLRPAARVLQEMEGAMEERFLSELAPFVRVPVVVEVDAHVAVFAAQPS